jgi:nitroreductase
MDFDKVLKQRASIKDYSNKTPKIDRVIDAIEAASLAPSPGNLQILKFIITEDKETVQKVAKACQQQFVQDAPIILIVCSDSKRAKIMFDKRAKTYVKHHVGAAIENLLLKITEMKLASTWVGAFSETTLRNLLKIPDNIDIEVVIPIAHPLRKGKTIQKRKPNLGNLVFFDTWDNKQQKKIRKTGTH